MDDETKLVVAIMAWGLLMLTFLGIINFYNFQDENTKRTICNTLELGKYESNTAKNNKEIDGQKYFKCTKDIYNSTTKEIITSEKWVRLP